MRHLLAIAALYTLALLVVGFEAYTRHKVEHEAEWERTYHWPFMFFSAVLFWNLVGAGLFGFLINPPIALYYMQGLNTTANHGHAALFGVYGMLGLGLTLYCMRGLTDVTTWNQKSLKIAFWSLNIGIAMMTVITTFEASVRAATEDRAAGQLAGIDLLVESPVGVPRTA